MKEAPSPFGVPSDYLPQKPPMQVLDRIFSVTESEVCCGADSGPEGPLAVFADGEGRLPSELAVELLAQCVGVWAGFQRRARNDEAAESEKDAPIGFLLSVRGMKVEGPWLPRDEVLRVTMTKLVYEESMGSFEGQVTSGGRAVASGRVSVFQPKNRDLAALLGSPA